MPPVHESHAVYRVQHHLGPPLLPRLPPPLEGRVLEEQANAVVTHVCAHVDGELRRGTPSTAVRQGRGERSLLVTMGIAGGGGRQAGTHQGKGHAHDDWVEPYEVESGDL